MTTPSEQARLAALPEYRHNGRISATESPGGGATITFSRPAVLRAATAAAA